MTETTKGERDEIRRSTDENMRREFQIVPVPLDLTRRVVNDADRLARYERDLFDERAGENRSQDTEWLRRGFLQRGAEIERLEDGIRALADELEWKYGDMGGGEQWVAHEAADRMIALLDGD